MFNGVKQRILHGTSDKVRVQYPFGDFIILYRRQIPMLLLGYIYFCNKIPVITLCWVNNGQSQNMLVVNE